MHGFRRARLEDQDRLAALRAMLWPETAIDAHRRELHAMLSTGMNGTLPAAVLVAEQEDGDFAGFLEVGLRSHADGCDPARPVGFIEGWFVRPENRKQGIGETLMTAAEQWAREQGCFEMASDTWLDNEASLRAHRALGFEVADRCIHLRKTL